MTYLDHFRLINETHDAAFARLLSKYESMLKGIVRHLAENYKRHLVGGKTDEDDLLQIANYALWVATYKFRMDIVEPGINPDYYFVNYAHKTVQGTVSDYLRKLAKRSAHEKLTMIDGTFDIVDPNVRSELHRLRDMFSDYMIYLTPRERIFVIDKWILDRKTSAIAANYHVSEDTVRTWGKNARKKLKVILHSEDIL
ncbi:MAG: sigma-70 family RNA polymerase sigma factor [Sporolactobacillus sp.]